MDKLAKQIRLAMRKPGCQQDKSPHHHAFRGGFTKSNSMIRAIAAAAAGTTRDPLPSGGGWE